MTLRATAENRWDQILYGVSKENPDQVCAVMQAEPGVMEQFMADHTEIIVASGHVLESTVDQVFVAG